MEVQVPQISDDDPDLNRLLAEFKNSLDCHMVGSLRLDAFKECFPVGSLRLKAYEREVSRGQRHGLLPDKADEVFVRVVARMARVASEIPRPEQLRRAEQGFIALRMGTLPHSKFRTLWEDDLDVLEVVGGHKPPANQLVECYLEKLSGNLQTAVLSRLWPLDGKNKPVRECLTWEDLANAADLCLDSVGRKLKGLPEPHQPAEVAGGAVSPMRTPMRIMCCARCHGNHTLELCPALCAALRGDAEDAERLHKQKGTVCVLCRQINHLDMHHALVAWDFYGSCPPPPESPPPSIRAYPHEPGRCSVCGNRKSELTSGRYCRPAEDQVKGGVKGKPKAKAKVQRWHLESSNQRQSLSKGGRKGKATGR